MMINVSKIVFAALFLCIVSANADAATLNTKIDLDGDVLTVADVFNGAENNGDHILGPAPKPGDVMILDNKTLSRIADGFKIDWKGRTPSATARVRGVAKGEAAIEPTANQMVMVPVLAAPMNREMVITAADITHIEVPVSKLNDDTILDDKGLIGQSVRGLIQPNMPVSKNLLAAPKVIKRGDMVTLSLSAGRIQLTSKGKALSDARIGDLVNIQNQSSEKIVQARVTGPQEAIIEPQI